MKKIEKDYQERYGNIPNDSDERFIYITNGMRITPKMNDDISYQMDNIKNIKWNNLNFVIYLLPKATPRPRHNGKRNIFYVSGAKDNKDIFKRIISDYGDIGIITTPCKFTCISYMPIPKSMSAKERILAEKGLIRPISKPDWDNLGKTYSDMIQGTLLLDDSLIVEGVSKKFYSFKPRIEIHIEYMEAHDSLYNERKIRKKVE